MTVSFRVPSIDFNYVPSDEDVVWAAVALYGETRGSHSEAEWGRILWTWMNRFLLHVPRPRVWPTLQNLIMNHSQPVNPKWRLGGSRCPVAGSGSSNCSNARLAWRDNMAILLDAGFTALDYIPPDMADFVLQFFNGGVPQKFGADGYPMIDFGVTASAKNHGTRYEAGGNYFLMALQSQKAGLLSNFLMEEVVVVNGGGSSIPGGEEIYYPQDDSPLVTLVVTGVWVGAAMGAIWYLLRRPG